MITELRNNLGFIALAAGILFFIHIAMKKMGKPGGLNGKIG